MKLILVNVFAYVSLRHLNIRFLLFAIYKKLDEDYYFFIWKEK
jgi:hypothetical protein